VTGFAPDQSTADRSVLLAQTFARHAIVRSAIMASSFRSGSSYVAKILGRNGLKGIDQERFNKVGNADDVAAYLDTKAQYFAGRLFPTKIMWPHRCDLARALDLPRSKSRVLAQSFPDATWIHVTRNDKFRQAISLWRAKASGRWHVRDGSPEPDIAYDFEGIDRASRAICLQERLWDDFFGLAAIAPIRLVYEHVVADPGLLAPVVSRFGFSLVETEVKLRKQSDDTTERHLEQYMTDLYRRGF